MNVSNLVELYQYFDDLVEQDTDSDTLFASSYLRGFIALVSSQFGDETQSLSTELFAQVSEELDNAKSELTPQDHVIVNNYWLTLQKRISE
ncbi:YfcL family protein [Colwelliaceae bacterium 6441]